MTAQPSYKAALIGAGRIAGSWLDAASAANHPVRTHGHALWQNPNFDLRGVLDADLSRGKAFGERWGVPVATHDINVLLKADDWDLVIVCSPDQTHVETLHRIVAADATPPLIVMEKPLCQSRTDLAGIEAALASTPDTKLVVNHTRRFEPRYRQMHALISSGALGTLVTGRWNYYGGWFHTGVHLVDALRMLLDDEFDCLAAKTSFDGHPGDPCVDVTFRRRSGEPGVVHLEGFPESCYQQGELMLCFTKGRLRCTFQETTIWLDLPVTNQAGEVEIKPNRIIEASDGSTAMSNLYQRCAEYLSSRDHTVFEGVDFTSARDTLLTLFEVKERSIGTP